MAEEYAVELRDVVKKFGEVTAVNQVSLKIRDGEFFSLLGPSGCGKTTTLRLIAGFEIPTSGDVFIGGQPQGYLPPFKRPVNTVFQHYALFPHMTIFKNISFGLEMKKVPRSEIKMRVAKVLDLVDLMGMENRRPSQLSGGQQQRVALARALVNQPKVLLLDEPLGALDLKLRKAMQVELKSLQSRVGITFIYVTHDQEEALTMSDRIGVMNQGNLLQVGSAVDIYESPQTRFVADFIGDNNYLEGRVVRMIDKDKVELSVDQETTVRALRTPDIGLNQRVFIAFRPEKVNIITEAPQDHNQISGVIKDIVYTGSTTTYTIILENGSLINCRQQNVQSLHDKPHQLGAQVTISWPIPATKAFPQ